MLAQWTDPACAVLMTKPVEAVQGYGMAPNVTSWGGNVVFFDGQYHLFVAEMVNHCPLSDWGRNSQISHAVAATPTGPFKFRDVAVPVWSHNPQVVLTADDDGRALFALFHIGDGTTGGPPANCTAGHWKHSPPVAPSTYVPALLACPKPDFDIYVNGMTGACL
mgnify:CR=1 FL=1